jgi:hypothetical protein
MMESTQVAVASFSAFVLSSADNILTPQVTFTSLAVFNILRMPMNMLSNLIGQTVQLIVSNRRIKEFLCCEELDALNGVTRIAHASPTLRTPCARTCSLMHSANMHKAFGKHTGCPGHSLHTQLCFPFSHFVP